MRYETLNNGIRVYLVGTYGHNEVWHDTQGGVYVSEPGIGFLKKAFKKVTGKVKKVVKKGTRTVSDLAKFSANNLTAVYRTFGITDKKFKASSFHNKKIAKLSAKVAPIFGKAQAAGAAAAVVKASPELIKKVKSTKLAEKLIPAVEKYAPSLISKLQSGEMSPQEAEDYLINNNLPPDNNLIPDFYDDSEPEKAGIDKGTAVVFSLIAGGLVLKQTGLI